VRKQTLLARRCVIVIVFDNVRRRLARHIFSEIEVIECNHFLITGNSIQIQEDERRLEKNKNIIHKDIKSVKSNQLSEEKNATSEKKSKGTHCTLNSHIE